MKKFNMANVTRAINKAGFKLKKHSPELLIVAGVVGVVTSAVMACKATMKLNDTLTDTKEKVEDFHADEANYTEEEGKKTLTLIYSKAALDIAKLYGPSVVLGGLSITAILTSNNILRKRNIALAAAYTAVDKSFKEYRGRVIERFGKELDRELKYNIKAKEVEETVVSEDGTEVVEKKTIELADPNTYSPYAKFYDDGCSGWTKDSEANLMFLRMQQDAATKRLKQQGWLLLNDVYDMLGIPRTKDGMVIGWVYDEKHPVGDNFVDFGIYDTNRASNRDFVNGYERTILLDFNVDGNIYDLM